MMALLSIGPQGRKHAIFKDKDGPGRILGDRCGHGFRGLRHALYRSGSKNNLKAYRESKSSQKLRPHTWTLILPAVRLGSTSLIPTLLSSGAYALDWQRVPRADAKVVGSLLAQLP